MNKRLLVPFFLQKLDEKLLRNKPNTWAARTHLVIWFAVLFTLALGGFCYLAFFDARQYNSIGGWVTFVSLVAFIGFVFWIIFLLRFNLFKRYGNWFMWDGLKSFGLYFISIGAMVAVCFLPSEIQMLRANQQFGNEEIVNDINEINVDACKLEYELLPLQWKSEKYKVVNEIHDSPVTAEVEVDTIGSKLIYTDKQSMQLIDTMALRNKLAQTDSVIKVNDSIYIFFDCPDYTFVSSYHADEYTHKKIMDSKDIYYTVIKNYAKPDRVALLKKMDELYTKYATDNRFGYNDNYTDYNNNDNYNTRIIRKYKLGEVDNGLYNIVDKKYSWVNSWESYLRIFYYITLVLTLLVFIFRHTTVKTFFLSLLASVILMIFTGLLMVMSGGSDSSMYSFMIVYYVGFALLALSINASKVRSALQGIALNLFLFMTPFIPLIFVGLNRAIDRGSRYEEGNYYRPEEDKTALYTVIAEIAGIVILLILLEPLFRRLYRKWFAAPEN